MPDLTDTYPATGERMTDEQLHAAFEWVMEAGRRRLREQGEKMRESDYFCGAMAVYFALGCQDKIPGGWIFGPMAGTSILTTPKEKE